MGLDGLRASKADLFRSATKEERERMFRRASTTALKASIVAMDRDEILASVACIRNVTEISVLKEESELRADFDEGATKKDD